MKKTIIKSTSLVLTCIMLIIALCGCSTNDQIVASSSVGSNNVSVAMYSLMTSLTKGNLAYYITQKYGNYNSTEFWSTITDGNTQMTYREYYTFIVDEKVKNCLASLNLFDELGLSLTDSDIAVIDQEMADFVKEDGEGSKNTLNGILAEYGANYRTLRDYKIMNAKISKLSEHLYGTNASKIADNVKNDYLKNNYVAFRQILLPTYEYVYETDKYGDDIYYSLTSDGTIETATNLNGEKYEVIAYDTLNGITIDGENGIDKNGNKIYFVKDSQELHIAYSTDNCKRKNAIDENGYNITRQLNEDKINALKKQAEEIYSQIQKGDEKNFLDMIQKYDNNYGAEKDASVGNMCYLATNKTYVNTSTDGTLLDNICDEVEKLDVGEYTLYKSDYGFHIVMRFEVENGAYSESKYSGWFVDENKINDFNSDLVNDLFMERLAPYTEKITFDQNNKSKVDISKITPNYYFY